MRVLLAGFAIAVLSHSVADARKAQDLQKVPTPEQQELHSQCVKKAKAKYGDGLNMKTKIKQEMAACEKAG